MAQTKQSIIDEQEKEIERIIQQRKDQNIAFGVIQRDLEKEENAHKATKKDFRHTVDELKKAVACLEQDKARLEGYVCRINQVDQSQLPMPGLPDEPITMAEKHHIENLNPFRTPTPDVNIFTAIDSYRDTEYREPGRMMSRQDAPKDWYLL